MFEDKNILHIQNRIEEMQCIIDFTFTAVPRQSFKGLFSTVWVTVAAASR
jgi:hypothetical protein